jgi:Uma2 family endonuclease
MVECRRRGQQKNDVEEVTRMHVVFSPVSDDELQRLSELNPGWRFERDDAGATIVSPTFTRGGAKDGEAYYQLRRYADTVAGGKAFGSSTGFTMSTGAVRSPDASWLSPEQLTAFFDVEEDGYWRVCPDIVIEVASSTDAWADVCAKIEMYAREGARYAVAVDPKGRVTYTLGEPPTHFTLDAEAIYDA